MTSLEGRRFRSVADVAGGEVDTETVFDYHEEGDLIWARYAGGAVRLGHLVGLRQGERLEFRYSQLNTAGETSTGHCVSTVITLPDGRLRLHEVWEWESKDGAGTSAVEEISTA
jgi:hypothetical protein